jgi:hypothetical protein
MNIFIDKLVPFIDTVLVLVNLISTIYRSNTTK